MKAIRFLGDEASAAGFRLAGCEARVARDGEEAVTFAQACCEGAALLLVGAAVAARVPRAQLDAAIARARPPVVTLPDFVGAAPWPDPAASLARELGLEA